MCRAPFPAPALTLECVETQNRHVMSTSLGKCGPARCKLHDYESMVKLKSISQQLMLPAYDPGARFASQIPPGSSLGELRASSCVLCPLCS